MPNILIVGNCQTQQMAALFGLPRDNTVVRHSVQALREGRLEDPDVRLDTFDLILAQPATHCDLQRTKGFDEAKARIVTVPTLQFRGYHPDFLQVRTATGNFQSGCILAHAFAAGLSAEEAATLYNPTVFAEMGYYACFEAEKRMFLSVLSRHLDDPLTLFETWHAGPEAFYVPNHPAISTTLDMLRGILAGKTSLLPPSDAADFLNDPLKEKARFPTLNHPGSSNRLEHRAHRYLMSGSAFDCVSFARRCFWKFKEPGTILPCYEGADLFNNALDAHCAETRIYAVNPYKAQPEHAFWKTAVVEPEIDAVTPSAGLVPVIGPGTRVATAGSCFAYHIAKSLKATTQNYFLAEPPPANMAPDEADRRGYGMFSARYGNIYSPRPLKQLLERAYGDFVAEATAWPAKGGDGWIDPFRPNIGEVFESPDAVEAARKTHFAAVQHMFETLDVFIFTLGLTECWTDATDGAAFPVAPGVVSDGVPADRVRFENFGPEAVVDDMTAFLMGLRAVNPGAQVILTVSPVPLIATWSSQDALTASTYNKSTLRSAAGRLADIFDCVQYFPSYEIATGPHARGRYFTPNLRALTPEGMEHVMGVFLKTMVTEGNKNVEAPAPVDFSKVRLSESYEADAALICDEELSVRY